MSRFDIRRMIYNPVAEDTYAVTSKKENETLNEANRVRQSKKIGISVKSISNAKTLNAWTSLPEKTFLVHTLQNSYIEAKELTPLLTNSAESLFAKWEVLSTSLVDVRNPAKFLAPVGGSDIRARQTRTLGVIGLILEVPPQNILGVHADDCWFDNRAGATSFNAGVAKWEKASDSYKLADHVKSGIDMNGDLVEGGSFTCLQSPTDLLEKTFEREKFSNDNKIYSEILVLGRKDVNLHPLLKKTEHVKVTGILVWPNKEFVNPEKQKVAAEKIMSAVEKLKTVNPKLKNVPVTYVDDGFVKML